MKYFTKSFLYFQQGHKSLKILIFDAVIKYTKRIMLLKIPSKNSCSLKNYVNVFIAEAFFVHESPPLVFKQFSTILHYFVMTQMILAFINTFQILDINLLMNLKV